MGYTLHIAKNGTPYMKDADTGRCKFLSKAKYEQMKAGAQNATKTKKRRFQQTCFQSNEKRSCGPCLRIAHFETLRL